MECLELFLSDQERNGLKGKQPRPRVLVGYCDKDEEQDKFPQLDKRSSTIK